MKKFIKKIKPVLKKEYYIREIMLLVVMGLSLLCYGIFNSLAIFQQTISKSSIASITAGTVSLALSSTDEDYNNSTNQITVAAGETITIPLTITNSTSVRGKYKLYYNLVSGTKYTETITNKEYTGEVQTMTLAAGTHKLEVWGAQGGSYSTTYYGGKGGYSYGTLTLTSSKTAYIYVGGQPTTNTTDRTVVTGGFNGGGNGYNRYYSGTYTYGQGGGGASDIRIGTDSLYSRVIVAGGGSGSTNRTNGYYGGGTTSESGTSGYSASSTSAGTNGSFGQGGSASTSGSNYKYGSAGGGGGWYGGGASSQYSDSTNYDTYSGGGSGYVYTSSTASNYPSGITLTSSYYLTNAETISGDQSFLSPTGTSETGHSGNGYVRITSTVPSAMTSSELSTALSEITVAVTSSSETGHDEGVVSSNNTDTRSIVITNPTTSDITVGFGIEQGYSNNALTLSSGQNQLAYLYGDESGANYPSFASGMIPVTYDTTNDVWVKADTTSEWYNYDSQKWANAVTVRDCVPKGDFDSDGDIDADDYTTFQSYFNATNVAGTEAESADFNGDGEVDINDYAIFSQAYSGVEDVLCVNPVKNLNSYSLREYYQDLEAGTEIAMDDINAMWVWIPRFKYKIPNSIGSSVTVTNHPQIDVVFENGTEATGVTESVYRAGISDDGTNTNYYTHPAFRDIDNITYSSETTSRGAWDEEITGIWVGKFETGTNNSTCISSPSADNCLDVDPIIKPDVKLLGYQTVSTQFITSLKFAGGTMDTSTGKVTFAGSDIYGLTSSTDTHMMKNTEWGAVMILSQSQYGKMGISNFDDDTVYKNNSSGYYTGRSGGSSSATATTNGTYSYNDKSCDTVTTTTLGNTCTGSKTTNAGTRASTTGTIYGIYDMNVGGYEYVMGNWNNGSGYTIDMNSGFSGLNGSDNSTTDGISFPESKYYDLYKGTYVTGSGLDQHKDQAILGDMTWEIANYSTSIAYFVNENIPWFGRGVYGFFSVYVGQGTGAQHIALRTTLIP